MAAKPIMVVTLSVPPEKESEFNAFYQHRFLPAMLRDCPEIVSIRRYEEIGTNGSLRWYNKQFWTIYELSSEFDVENCDELFKRPAVADLVGEFQQWKNNHLRNFSRITFLHTWSHERLPWDGPFGNRPIFVWQHEMKPEVDEEFQEWYQESYLPTQIADIPGWIACRRYASINREQTRRLTIYEASDEDSIARCLNELRAGHRVWQNHEWHRKVEPALLWQDSATFRLMYRRPG